MARIIFLTEQLLFRGRDASVLYNNYNILYL